MDLIKEYDVIPCIGRDLNYKEEAPFPIFSNGFMKNCLWLQFFYPKKSIIIMYNKKVLKRGVGKRESSEKNRGSLNCDFSNLHAFALGYRSGGIGRQKGLSNAKRPAGADEN